MAAAAEAFAPSPVLDFAPVDLGGRCEIIPGSALPEFDGPGTAAFAARSLRDRKAELFALIPDGKVPARIEVMPAFRSMEHPNLVRLVDWGAVEWAPAKARRFALIYERPSGRRLFDSMEDAREPLPDDLLVRGILPTMLSILRDMVLRGVTAGAIRPTNLFFKDNTANLVVLGDCVSSPAGYSQPPVLETIERSMARPSGRGPGTVADDLYAVGVTLLMLAVGRNPLRGMEDEAVLRARMDKGSYQTLTAAVRVPQALIEPLRGLITDDPKQRWSISDLDLWLQGRRLSPKQPQAPKRGGRPLEIAGEEHWHCRAIARGLTANPALSAPLIERGDLDKWLRRSLSDDQRADQVQAAVDSAGIGGSRGASQEDRVVARVGIALDPPAPIRYRNVSVMPDGIGTALAEAFCIDAPAQPLAEMVLTQLPMFWVSCQTDFRPEHVPLVQTFDLQRMLMEHTGPGFGIERVLYELNPACPCQSPLVRDRYVLSIAELLSALDLVAGRPGRGREPFDRHVGAFLAAHNKKLNDRMLNPLAGKGDPGRRIVAMMYLLADAQTRFGPARLPDLCDWLVSLLDPALKRFKHRQTRDELQQKAEKLARDGVIEPLVKLLDNAEAIRRDEKGFALAMRQHEVMTKQIERLEAAIKAGGQGREGKGRQVAATVSCILAMCGLILTLVVMAGG